MLFKKIKDLKNRKIYNNLEKYNSIKKFVLINFLSKSIVQKNAIENRKRTIFLISKLKLKFRSKVKIVRRCILTNRGRRVLRKYNFSHTIFRNLNQLGLIPGCKKAVW
jgi:ribosomal protein S14